MEIQMEVGMWFEVREDKDGDIIINMPYDNNGNEMTLYVKQDQRRFFNNLIEEGLFLMNEKEVNKIIERVLKRKKKEDLRLDKWKNRKITKPKKIKLR